MKTLATLAIAGTMLGCAAAPPKAAIQRTGTEVNASAGRVWDAVVRQFADLNIPIRTMERASGYISTDHFAVTEKSANLANYDCGKTIGGQHAPATDVVYNVLVRGDSTRANVKVTARWITVQSEMLMSNTSMSDRPVQIVCTSQGGFENYVEQLVKKAAEGTP